MSTHNHIVKHKLHVPATGMHTCRVVIVPAVFVDMTYMHVHMCVFLFAICTYALQRDDSMNPVRVSSLCALQRSECILENP